MIYRFYYDSKSDSYLVNLIIGNDVKERYSSIDTYNILTNINRGTNTNINILNGNFYFQSSGKNIEIINFEKFVSLGYSDYISNLIKNIKNVSSVYSRSYYDNVPRKNINLKAKKVRLSPLILSIISAKGKVMLKDINYDGMPINNDFDEILIDDEIRYK